ncbi:MULTISPECIES: DUF6230 family protein [Streptomyces]|uniref:Cholesterol esterase n=4 Tax=Streptomyces TaxID=1883 RepID=A0A8H9HGJ3_9ACTN|nr:MULTISPECIES: DUF6230 family protein [Streptomyces]NEE38352.1 cholesterol esterase [Streptomyces sp. SID7982]NEE45084.1 cholesterol esterase [Streptomyces sp. SID8455]MBL3804321.1 cholesterol esterase [Streptomyces sp. BRB081]MDQ0293122.1 hypothetical protein [Streptomyces sp. DSM 41037]NEC13859.1 cholesterol esterase [Streptomyces sp. SID8014]
MESVARGGTRWKRFAVVMVPTVAATAAIGVAVSQGALAASFAVSGQSFKVSADKLVGNGFVQYGGVDTGYDLKGKKGAHPVAISAFKTAQINNMCQSVVTPDVPLIGTISLQLKAGTGKAPVEAENLYIDVAQLDADAEFKNINIGVAAGESTKGPGIKKGDQANPYGFSQEADSATLKNVKQTAWATTAGTFKLSGLSMKLHKGVKECY